MLSVRWLLLPLEELVDEIAGRRVLRIILGHQSVGRAPGSTIASERGHNHPIGEDDGTKAIGLEKKHG